MIRRMDRPNPRVPIVATGCCALFALAALVARLTHHISLTFYCGFGFFAVVMIVLFLNWEAEISNAEIKSDGIDHARGFVGLRLRPRPQQPSPYNDDGRRRNDQLSPDKRHIVNQRSHWRNARLNIAKCRQSENQRNRNGERQ
jgi:hypothetical protein